MPKIQSLLNGEVKNVRGDIARELVAMGVATILEEDKADGFVRPRDEAPYRLPRLEDAVIPEPQWSVEKHGESKPLLVIVMRVGNSTATYSGSPANVNRKNTWEGCPKDGGHFWNGFGRPVPAEIVELYAREWMANPELRGNWERRFTTSVPFYGHIPGR